MKSTMIGLKIIAILVLSLSTALFASASDKDPSEKESLENLKAFIINQADIDRQLAWKIAPVKTEEDLYALLRTENPLDLLSPDAKERFIQSLVFRPTGLGSFYVTDLKAELTVTEIYEVLALFGQQEFAKKMTTARVETNLDALLISNNQSNSSEFTADPQ